MSYPDFACMGFQKCGTTTLFEILKQHPEVVLCRDVKEPMYYRIPKFAQVGLLQHLFYRWRYFGHVPKNDRRLKGEINAGLTFTGCVEKVTKNYDPDTKMIFMIRDPVSRSYSSYKYFLARGFLPEEDIIYDRKYGHARGFDHYCRRNIGRRSTRKEIMKKRLKYLVFSQSNYATCVEEYLVSFSGENMMFVVFEEFIKDQHAACRPIYEFLGIRDSDEIDYSIRANEGKERASDPRKAHNYKFAKGWNYGFYEFACLAKWAPKLYDRWNGFYRRIRDGAMEPDDDDSKVLPETRRCLMKYYRNEVLRMEKITGRNLREIWNWE